MDIKSLVEDAISLAETASVVLPQLGSGAKVAQSILDVVDGLKEHAPDGESQAELEAAHEQLYEEMTAKGHTLSDRLRG